MAGVAKYWMHRVELDPPAAGSLKAEAGWVSEKRYFGLRKLTGGLANCCDRTSDEQVSAG